MLDLNLAEKGNPPSTVIPKGTILPVQMNLRPGGAGEGGWLKRNNAGNALMMDCEFTVLDGDFAKRKFWTHFVTEGETEGQKKAAEITKQRLRQIVESALGIEPSDESEAAVKARRLNDYSDLDGVRFLVAVGVDKSEGYAEKNVFGWAVTPDRKDWRKLEQVHKALPTARPPAAEAQRTAGSPSRPKWAN